MSYRCPKCRSTDIYTDLRCCWDVELQEWQIDDEPDAYSECGCEDCEHVFKLPEFED